MKLPLLLVTIAVIYLSQGVGGSKILGVFWTPSKSHHILGSALLQALAKKGHNVTLLSPFIDDVDIPNFKQIKLTGIEGSLTQLINPKSNILKKTITFVSSFGKNTEKFWNNKPVQDLIKSRDHYDVVLSLNFFNDGLLALNHHLGAPTIIFHPAATTSGSNKYVANPNLPYYDNPFLIKVGPHTSFFARMMTTTLTGIVALIDMFIMTPVQQSITQSYLPTSPPILELRKNISLLMVNAHTSLEPTRPYVPNMVQIGGFYAQTTKKLPDNLQKYLDSAKDGAILFSFGTNMKIAEVEKDKLDAIMEGLRKIAPIKVLFKSEIDLKDAPKNVLVSKWLPQNDILAHPNIKAFITHGGLGGNTEAVYHGVPMIGIPLFADQKTNIENAVKSGYAVRIFYEDINQKTVDEALEQILKNPSYTEKAKKRSSLLRKQPMNPMDKAIWWVEHIIEHKGGEHLRNLGMDLEWYQLYMVDIMLFYLVVIVIMLTTSILSMRWIIRKLFFKNKNKTKNKKSKKE
ncbi:UDP-glycosyltransferase UGT5-like isoform X5 [Harmonia axyridis]|uniref:UDP-glycosyltransferase UGT5-like isoform X5 n=1 Tax=Harmonia axyridis TaxID=115357 RepID=UPI001E277828|nr:UDP-glycosyltransferase UGT5-like isoform X5 [Harmonia axyridis]